MQSQSKIWKFHFYIWSFTHSLAISFFTAFSALTLLVGRQEGWWGAGVVICLELGADLHAAQLMPLPLTISCFIKIQTGFTFLVPAHPGSPGKRAIKRVCVCVVISFLMLCFYCMRGQLLTGHDGSTSSRECRRSRRQTAQCHAANLECWVESTEDDRSGQATIW